jgi:hypothetical protein
VALLMTLEGPKVPQLSGIWGDAWDYVTGGIQDVWSTVTGDDLRSYSQPAVTNRVLKRTPLRGLGLNTWLDPVKLHPLMLIAGIGIGIWAANRYGKARR